MKIYSTLIFTVIVLTACSIGSIENNSWSGTSNIAGVTFTIKLVTKSDNTYKLTCNGLESYGTYQNVSYDEIILTTGEYKDYKFEKGLFSLEMYMDSGDYFMSLY